MDVEHAVITCMVVDQDDSLLARRKVRREYFYDEEHLLVLDLILKHFIDHRKIPSEEVIQASYPNYHFDVSEYQEPIDYYVKRLQDLHIFKIVTDGVLETIPALTGEGPSPGQDALDTITEIGLQARIDVPSGMDESFFTESLDLSLESYDLRKEFGRMRGVTTGFRAIDDATGGLQAEHLVTLIALPGIGKSSLMLAMALNAAMNNSRVMFVTFEMSVEEQRDRATSLLSEVSLNRILDGMVSNTDLIKINRSLRKHQLLTDNLVFVHEPDNNTTLTGMQAKINELDPDVVFIDGVYLMDDEHGELPNSSRALTNITRGLKRMARSNKICVVISTQALTHKTEKGRVHMNSAGYSSSFAQDSDIVFVGNTVPDNPGIISFRADKVRSGPNAEQLLRFNWDQGRIDIIEESELQQGGSEVDPAETANVINRINSINGR